MLKLKLNSPFNSQLLFNFSCPRRNHYEFVLCLLYLSLVRSTPISLVGFGSHQRQYHGNPEHYKFETWHGETSVQEDLLVSYKKFIGSYSFEKLPKFSALLR